MDSNAAGAANAHGLTITNPGTTAFGGLVGGINPLASLSTGTGPTVLNGGGVTTDGAAGQLYNGSLTLANAATAPALTTLAAGAGPVSLGPVIGTPNGSQALAITTTGTTTLGDVVGAGTFALASLSTGSGPVALNGGAVTTNGAAGQFYNGAVTLGAATTLTAGTGPVVFASTLDGTTAGAQGLALTTSGAQTFTGAVGTKFSLASLSTGSGTVNLDGGAVTTLGDQLYNGPVKLVLGGTVAAPKTTTLSAANVSFTSTVDGDVAGAETLAVNAAGNETFTGAVGGTVALATLTTDAGGSLGGNTFLSAAGTDAAPSVTTTGAQTYNDPVLLGANTVLKGSGVALGSTLDGTANHYNLTLTLSGAQTISGGTAAGQAATPARALGTFNNLGNFVANGTGTTTAGGDFETYGSQTFGTPVFLSGDWAFRSDNAGAISFAAVNGDTAGTYRALSVFTEGATTFNGRVGGINPLGSVTTDAGGTTAFNVPSGVAVTTVNNGTATGAQTYNDNVTLTLGVTLASNAVAPGTAGGPIAFGGTVDGPGALTLNTTGATSFAGAVGGTAPLASLTIGAGSVAGTTLATGTVNTTGAQTYNSPLVLGANATLGSTNADATAGAITFGSTVGGAGFSLTTVTQGGNTVFGSGSGSVTGALLGSLTTSANGNTVFNNAAFETSGSQTYQGPATPGVTYTGGTVVQSATHALTLTSDTGNIVFGGTLTSPASATTQASDLTVTANAGTGQSVAFGGAVGGGVTATSASALNSLTVNSPTITIDGGVVNTASTNPFSSANAGVQTYNGAVALGADTTFVGKTLMASGGVDAQNHNLTLTFSDQVTVPPGTGFANINSFTSNGAGGTNIAGDFTTAGFQHYDNVTTLGADVVLNAGAAGIRFGSTLGSPGTAYTLALGTTGPVEFDGVVGGGNAPLGSLGITGGGTVSINGGAITTVDFQNYGGPVVLGATGGQTTLTSNAGGQIAFSSTLNGLTAGTQSLTLSTTGTMIFTDLVGGTAALRGLTTGSGTADINAASVTTQGGGQNYQGPVSFDGTAGVPVALKDTAGGALNFGSTVDNFAGGGSALTLSTSGALTFSGAVGGIGALGSLTVTGGGTLSINGGSVVSSAFQAYNGPVQLGNTATLASTNGGNLTFNSTLNGAAAGAQGLTLNTAGNEVFGGLVGNNFALASLTTDDPAAGAAGGQAQFNMAIGTAAQGVNVSGDVTIHDAVLFAATGSTLAAPTVRTGGSQAYDGGGTATGNTALVGGGTLTSGGTLDFGGNDLSVRFGGQVTVLDSFTGVRNFVSDGAGGTLLDGTFTTTGTQTYGDAVTLDGTPVLNAVGNITFNSTVDGNAPLTLNVTGPNGVAVFNKLVGNGTALLGLTTNTTGGTQFLMDAGTAATNDGGVNVGMGGVSVTGPVLFGALNSTTAHPTVAAVGAQTYNGAATLGANTALNGTGDITFGSTVDGAFTLAVSSAGSEVFDNLVGGTTPLTGLTTDATGAIMGQAQFSFGVGAAQAGVRVNGPIVINDGALFEITGTSVNGTAVVPSVLTLGNGAQTYNGPVTLGTQTTVFASTAGGPAAANTAFTGGGAILFGSGVASADGMHSENLYVRTDVGQTRILGGLDANSTDLGGATVTFQGWSAR